MLIVRIQCHLRIGVCLAIHCLGLAGQSHRRFIGLRYHALGVTLSKWDDSTLVIDGEPEVFHSRCGWRSKYAKVVILLF